MAHEFWPLAIFLFTLFLLLGSGVWIGLALLGVAFVGMELFTTRPVGDAMMTTIWRSSSSWSLTALPSRRRLRLTDRLLAARRLEGEWDPTAKAAEAKPRQIAIGTR